MIVVLSIVSRFRFEIAETIYREDLERNRNNGWGLLGLHLSLEAQGKQAEAEALEPMLTEVWARADVMPSSSCYCEPMAVTP